MIQVRTAVQADVDAVAAILDEARAALAGEGIDQWQTGYPNGDDVCGDVRAGIGFVVVDYGGEGEKILGYLAVDMNGEPAYDDPRAEWSTTGPYAAVHRMAFCDAARGRGLAHVGFGFAAAYAESLGAVALRADTHPDNLRMQHVLEREGFGYRGLVWFCDGDKVAYDRGL